MMSLIKGYPLTLRFLNPVILEIIQNSLPILLTYKRDLDILSLQIYYFEKNSFPYSYPKDCF